MSDKELLLEVIENVESQIKAIKKAGGKWWVILDKVAQLAATQTEKVAGVDWSGVDKKEFSMEIVDYLWFRYANIKQIPDFIEKPLVKFIASKAIEAFVALMNKSGKWKHA